MKKNYIIGIGMILMLLSLSIAYAGIFDIIGNIFKPEKKVPVTIEIDSELKKSVEAITEKNIDDAQLIEKAYLNQIEQSINTELMSSISRLCLIKETIKNHTVYRKQVDKKECIERKKQVIDLIATLTK